MKTRDIDNLDYVIKIDELLEFLEKAKMAGYPPVIIINGQYYHVDFKREVDNNEI